MLDKNVIGERLRNIRTAKGLSIADVSKATGLGCTAISNYECGTRIPRDEAKIMLANFYEVSVVDIFFA